MELQDTKVHVALNYICN